MKFKNNNSEVIKKISDRSLKTNKVRNIVAVIAIILTTFMISSIFTVGISCIKNFNIMTSRMSGTTANVTLPFADKDQEEALRHMDIFESMGYEIDLGKVNNLSDKKVALKYCDDEDFNKQIAASLSDIKGNYPSKENEIMITKSALDFMKVNQAGVGDKLSVDVDINGENKTVDFIISGVCTNYSVGNNKGFIYVSKEFTDKRSMTAVKNGCLSMTVKDKYKDQAKDIISEKIKLNDNQKLDFQFSNENESNDMAVGVVAVLGIITLFVMVSGYLLIYNVIHIAVVKDINFYGKLKTIGASPKQIKRIVNRQSLRLSIIGIPVGIILASVASFVVVPIAMSTFSNISYMAIMPKKVYFNPFIFVMAALFSLMTVMISSRRSAKIAGSISPIEALKYNGMSNNKKKSRKSTNGGKIYKMAYYNVFRDKKRAVLVFLSLFMGVMTFLCVNSFVSSFSTENYIKVNVPYDFSIKNTKTDKDALNDKLIADIRSMNGVNYFDVSKAAEMKLDFNNDIYKTISDGSLSKEEYNKFKEIAGSDFRAYIVGISDDVIKDYNRTNTNNQIDLAEFSKGNIAVVNAFGYGDDLKKLNGKDIDIISSSDNKKYTFKSYAVNDLSSMLPDVNQPVSYCDNIYISSSALDKMEKNFINISAHVNVNKEFESDVRTSLEKLNNSNSGLDVEAKSKAASDFDKTNKSVRAIGTGISAVLMIIGLINFINVMITSVNSRLKELAVLESIGMTKKQVKKMLSLEGIYYAVITMIMVLTIGMVILFGLSRATVKLANYADFVFPALELIMLAVIILVICILTPYIVFKNSQKSSIIDRIREN